MTNISSKVTERRLKWFGHVQRHPLEHACRQIMDMKPPGKRKTKDKVGGCCERRHENSGNGKVIIAATPDDGKSRWKRTQEHFQIIKCTRLGISNFEQECNNFSQFLRNKRQTFNESMLIFNKSSFILHQQTPHHNVGVLTGNDIMTDSLMTENSIPSIHFIQKTLISLSPCN